MRTTNIFFKRKNRFKREFEETEYSQVKLVNNCSIKVSDEHFTNFLSENGTMDEKTLLEKLCKSVILENQNIDRFFDNDELYESIITTQRLLNIFNNYSTMNLTDITGIIKFKSKENSAIQFYMKENGDTLEILLIDLYHLGIPSEYRKIKSGQMIKVDYKKVFEKKEKNNYCISHITNSVIEKVD